MRILLAVALAASVILNVVLLVRWRAAEATPRSSPPLSGAYQGSASEHGAGAAPAAAPADRPAHATLAACEHALFDAERRLATTRARLWTSLPMPEKFEAAEPNPAVEAPLRSELARLFAAKDLEGAAWDAVAKRSRRIPDRLDRGGRPVPHPSSWPVCFVMIAHMPGIHS